ncbi:hypothetical protein [Oryza sativa Japonica Group]|uniref:Uncharacterized protein n=2 Tax=Oryza sativa subsp. japonica TaxID=39947 RepID=Q5VRT4_ORYSJ|nr:hypothetical protein [Oryza sativa Japonica Group]BAD68078.1 hypothetical protein [Oryza sativa Japonica Group]
MAHIDRNLIRKNLLDVVEEGSQGRLPRKKRTQQLLASEVPAGIRQLIIINNRRSRRDKSTKKLRLKKRLDITYLHHESIESYMQQQGWSYAEDEEEEEQEVASAAAIGERAGGFYSGGHRICARLREWRRRTSGGGGGARLRESYSQSKQAEIQKRFRRPASQPATEEAVAAAAAASANPYGP